MAAASASLALAACGGGGDSVKTVAQPNPVLPTEPPVRPEPDCTMEPRPAGCPEPAVTMPLAGLGQAAKGSAVVAIGKPLEGVPFTFSLGGSSSSDNRSVHYTSLVNRKEDIGGIAHDNNNIRYWNTKIPKVVPSGRSGGISYMFDMFYKPRNVAWTDGYAQVQQPLRDEEKIFSLENNGAYTEIKSVESITTQFGEDWDYSVLKANVPSMKDGKKDATLYAEVWTDLPGSSSSDYMVGGWWLLVPNSFVGDYRYGVFARGEQYFTKGASGGSGEFVLPLAGTATYKGAAAGLHTSSEDNIVKVSRLLGKVTINVDFEGTGDRGNLKGRIHDLTLDGNGTTGEIFFNSSGDLLGHNILDSPAASSSGASGREAYNRLFDIGNINGVNYKGRFIGIFTGNRSSDNTKHPSGITGVIGGTATDNSGLFTASFGAKKVEAETQ